MLVEGRQQLEGALEAREELLVPPVLGVGPLEHLRGAARHKQPPHGAAGGDVEPHPLVDLAAVVGARHVREQPALGLLVFLGPVGAQAALVHVAPQVAQLHHGGEAEARVDLGVAHGGVQRVVDEVAQDRREHPVVRAVTKQVGDGHRGVAEVVHKDGLQNALGVVRGVEDHGQSLHQQQRGVGARGAHQVAVDLFAQEVEGQVARQGPRVLGDEHQGVGHLRPEVLEDHEGAAAQPVVLGEGLAGVQRGAARLRVRALGYRQGEALPARVVLPLRDEERALQIVRRRPILDFEPPRDELPAGAGHDLELHD
mmetsp:Transcript_7584/g.19292  ORF Transcript_7584/g.19292 Transcript_7584/m.19292 type:complete len:312 (+) Transcript_7584:146-1081(+)